MLGVRMGQAAAIEDTSVGKRNPGEAAFLSALTASAQPGAGAERAALKVSSSVDTLGASVYFDNGRVHNFNNVVPFLSLQGADATGFIKDYKLQISGGILQVTEYEVKGAQ